MPAVLVADNDSAISALLVDVLTRVGLAVGTAFDGDAALAAARDPAVRVFVCDLDMPRVSGVEVLEALRDLPAPPAVVVISGYLDAALHERLAALPFVRAILRKPFDLLAFAQRVRELVAADSLATAV
jgi:CheY-like chemotaxis protein